MRIQFFNGLIGIRHACAKSLFFCLGFAALSSAEFAQAAPPPKPNIVFIFMDDMGYGDIAPFGSTKNRTPCLDRMAKEGMKLTSFYAAPVCSASRSQFMTGCYAPRISFPGVLSMGDKYGLNPAEHTVAELLKEQGYTTMCVGKWHLGDQPVFLPTRHGFDDFFGLPYSNNQVLPSAELGKPVVPILRGEKIVDFMTFNDQDRWTERLTEEAVNFIRAGHTKPFFLYLAHAAVHTPIQPGLKFKGKSANGRFGDWVEESDWSVGQVLNALRETGLDKNTLVIFSSDKGPWLAEGSDAGTAEPLRGCKGSTWEGGMREPTLAWWPGHVPAGSVCDAVAGTIDLLPTFVALAGGTVPTDRKIDGADIRKLLLGQSKESSRKAHYYFSPQFGLAAVRSGPWKLALLPQNYGMTGKRSDLKDLGESKPGLRLYNLETDIGESTSVAAEHPEVVTKLQALAQRMKADLGDNNDGSGVRPVGVVANPTFLFPVKEGVKPGKNKKGES